MAFVRHNLALDLGTAKIGICVAKVQERDIHIVHYNEIPLLI